MNILFTKKIGTAIKDQYLVLIPTHYKVVIEGGQNVLYMRPAKMVTVEVGSVISGELIKTANVLRGDNGVITSVEESEIKLWDNCRLMGGKVNKELELPEYENIGTV